MNAARPVTKAGANAWHGLFHDRLFQLGVVIGFAPVLAGLIFRTYGYHVTPVWAELLRQLDVPFILVEVAVVLWARKLGLSYRAVFDRLDRPAQFALCLFLGSFWISSAFISAEPSYSLLRASFWFVHIAFGFAVFHLASTATRDGLARCGAALFGGFAAFLPLMAIHLATAPDPALVREGKIIWSSAIPGCLSVRHLGIWAGLLLAWATGALYTRAAGPRERGLVYATIFLATAVLFWSGTRAGVFGLVGGAVVILATVRALPLPKTCLMAGIAIILGIIVSRYWLPPESAFGLLRRVGDQANGDLENLSSGRIALWTSMMQAFAESPIFGVGEGAVHWLTGVGDDRNVQPHNSVVQMLSSWGLVATTAAAYMLARLLVLTHRLARRDTTAIPLALMIDCLLLMSLADGVLYFSRFIMWFAGGTAVALALAVRDGAFAGTGIVTASAQVSEA